MLDAVMKRLLPAVVCVAALMGAPAWAQRETLKAVNQLELQGHFKETAALLGRTLSEPALLPADRKLLELELDRLTRIKQDFPLTKETLFAALKDVVQGLSAAEFERWIDEGRFDSREIDAERRFMSASVANLFFRYPELNPRRQPPRDTTPQERLRWETCAAIKRAAQAEHKPYVLPKRFHSTLTVTAAPNAAPDGELIRAWLPLPRQYPFQGGFELLAASSPPRRLDDELSAIRCLFLQQPAWKDKPTVFTVDYNFTVHGVWFDVEPDKVRPADAHDPALQEFLREAPHVVFTPAIRALARDIVGAETNPYLRAKKCYDWIAEHIKYSYAIEYSTIRNISDYCLRQGYGDCGQEALLFMALCRLNGIPARWQSGWNTFPGEQTIHDWSEVYLAPYGWMPVDPYMGVFAMRYATSLTPPQRRELRDFYFGGLDQYRMIANGGHNQTLTPPKQSLRSDDVDFQRGELEWAGHNIYFDQYKHEFTVKEIKLPARNE